ncbi:MAG: serine/threonine protein kinase [Pirellulales bacterium]|nr:serine/threonine protein kinase [Pirellulales bacterium]
MSTSDRSTFRQCAIASGLLTEQQIDEARAGVGWANGDEPDTNALLTDRQLAERLVAMGWLNAWQAKQLLDGRTKFTLGSYKIVDSLGQGGMGQVFKAEHSVMGRVVAVKVLPLSKTTPAAVANFTHEIRALGSLDHPRLVRAWDAGQDGSVYYLVTEFVPGTDLRKLVRHKSRLSMEESASIVYQVADGLDYAHSKGLVHRDVKPGNVLVTPEGKAKLSDLGLAGPVKGSAETDPRYGKIVGTPDYVAPDHVHSPWDPTPAWDIYSLGCTLYYAATGKVPFPGGTAADKARAHCELRPLDPRRLNKSLSDEFVDLMADMLAKNPSERIQSAAEVMARLEPWADDSVRHYGSLAVPGRPILPTSPQAEARSSPNVLRNMPPRRSRQSTPGKRSTGFRKRQARLPEVRHEPSSTRDSLAEAMPGETDKRSYRSAPAFRPLMLLVLGPLLLVGVAMLIWWLAQG